MVVIGGKVGREISGLASQRTQSLQDRFSRGLTRNQPVPQFLLLLRRQFFDGRFNFRDRAHTVEHSIWRPFYPSKFEQYPEQRGITVHALADPAKNPAILAGWLESSSAHASRHPSLFCKPSGFGGGRGHRWPALGTGDKEKPTQKELNR